MKKLVCLVLSLCLSLCLIGCTDNKGVSSDVSKPMLKAPVLTNLVREKDDFDVSDSTEKIIGKYDGDLNSLITAEEKALLALFKIPFDTSAKAEVIDKPYYDEKYIRAYSADYKIDFFEDGGIKEIYNTRHTYVDENRKRIYDTVESLEPLEKAVREALKIENMNIKREWLSHDTWAFSCTNKLDGRDLTQLNTYSIHVCSYDGALEYYTRGKREVTSGGTPIVTSEQAISFADPIFKEYEESGLYKTQLTYLAPNFYYEEGGPYKTADFVRLAWIVELDSDELCGTHIVYIDAETGEILGGGQYK